MIRKTRWAVALAFLMAAAPAKAGSTGDLYRLCTGNNPFELGYCMGYVAGIWPGLSCDVGNPTNGALEQAFKNWAAKHPEKWSLPAWLGVGEALRTTWPCH
jgi:hypothetical protein